MDIDVEKIGELYTQEIRCTNTEWLGKIIKVASENFTAHGRAFPEGSLSDRGIAVLQREELNPQECDVLQYLMSNQEGFRGIINSVTALVDHGIDGATVNKLIPLLLTIDRATVDELIPLFLTDDQEQISTRLRGYYTAS
ncbi:MAG: hypothetical protein LBE98_01650 [Puniceicoccales bacterium]|jgi:hypothetical protein|nr:hypothetical protein [Puniceicoccales bacterium]